MDIQVMEFPGHDLPTIRHKSCEAIHPCLHVFFQTTVDLQYDLIQTTSFLGFNTV